MITRNPFLMFTIADAAGGGQPAPVPAPVPQPTIPAGYLSQEQVNQLMARERREGGSKWLREQLGIENLDQAKELISAAQKNANDQKTAQEKAAEAQATAEAKAAEAQTLITTTRKQQALMLAGMPMQVTGADGKTVENPQVAYALKLLDLDANATPEAAAQAVATLKTNLPGLFTTPTAAPAGDPGRPPATTSTGATGTEYGKQRAAERAARLAPRGAARPTT